MAKFSLKVTGLKKAVTELRKLPPALQEPLILKLGKDAATRIKWRVFTKGQGRDINDEPFASKVDGDPSILRDSRDLMKTLKYNSKRERVEVGGGAVQVYARAHQRGEGPAYRNQKKPRKFFGISPSDEEALRKKTVKNVNKTIKVWAAQARHWKVIGKTTRGKKVVHVNQRGPDRGV